MGRNKNHEYEKINNKIKEVLQYDLRRYIKNKNNFYDNIRNIIQYLNMRQDEDEEKLFNKLYYHGERNFMRLIRYIQFTNNDYIIKNEKDLLLIKSICYYHDIGKCIISSDEYYSKDKDDKYLYHPKFSAMICRVLFEIQGFSEKEINFMINIIEKHQLKKKKFPKDMSELEIIFNNIDSMDEKCGASGALIALQYGKHKSLNTFDYDSSEFKLKSLLRKSNKFADKLATNELKLFYYSELELMVNLYYKQIERITKLYDKGIIFINTEDDIWF